MKRILLAITLAVLLQPAVPQARAGANISIDLFYNNLSDGQWIDVNGYGYCWRPEVAVNDSHWRPYTDGYWAYTNVGWTWVSYEDFGWATYHYGRWARLDDYGWVWLPGTKWGPAWVSWRTGGDYVGWAPLPPRRGYDPYGEVVYEGRPLSGSVVDIEFDIGPRYYNFCDVRYFGEPVLRRRILEPEQNITYINQTVNVTNITYNNNVVYNYGPDYNYVSAYSTRPIQRLELQRESNVDLSSRPRGEAMTKVEGNRLVVAAPQQIERPPQPAAPPMVKAKVEDPRVETGWSGLKDPDAKAQLVQQFKNENPKALPPPKVQPVRPEELMKASVATGLPAPLASPGGKEVAPAQSPAGPAPVTSSPQGGEQTAIAQDTKGKPHDLKADRNGANRPVPAQPIDEFKQSGEGKPARNVQKPNAGPRSPVIGGTPSGVDISGEAGEKRGGLPKQAAPADLAQREPKARQAQDANTLRKAEAQQAIESKKAAAQQQNALQLQQAEDKKAEREQNLKAAQDKDAARRAEAEQTRASKDATQARETEQLKQRADAIRGEREQKAKEAQAADSARQARQQEEAKSQRANQEQAAREAQRQQAESRQAEQARRTAEQMEARRAAQEQQMARSREVQEEAQARRAAQQQEQAQRNAEVQRPLRQPEPQPPRQAEQSQSPERKGKKQPPQDEPPGQQ